ncbi:hypothetical protein EV207_15220 [Scopulibacillus darangshiensis]|uniref:Uncharacterized protein n=1 Tax=Scopulibacillus darangshiensis TaxID=442528 RepID=A0A4V2SKP7_9BACL|nr:hypothetical protein [Scopulibacillus darangshiensis]TCP20346.1 hypothetical protein EV207_15220 [Scopulibacillus darangshiensis]
MNSNGIKRGQAITFRVPSDTPDHLLKQLQKLKDNEKRNFSSKMAEYVLNGVGQSLAKERETLTIPLPQRLNKEQRDWVKHAHSEALLGNVIYQLLLDPIRVSSVMATLNSQSLDIDQALHLQEYSNAVSTDEKSFAANQQNSQLDELEFEEDSRYNNPLDAGDDDLEQFDWDKAKQEQSSAIDENEESDQEETVEDLLGGFLSRMND